jgi:hypothetical protein
VFQFDSFNEESTALNNVREEEEEEEDEPVKPAPRTSTGGGSHGRANGVPPSPRR